MTQIRYLSLLISQLCNDTKIEYSNLSNGIGNILDFKFLNNLTYYFVYYHGYYFDYGFFIIFKF